MPYETPFSWHGKRAVPVAPEIPVVSFRCRRCGNNSTAGVGAQIEASITVNTSTFCYPCVVLILREWCIHHNDVAMLDGGSHEER